MWSPPGGFRLANEAVEKPSRETTASPGFRVWRTFQYSGEICRGFAQNQRSDSELAIGPTGPSVAIAPMPFQPPSLIQVVRFVIGRLSFPPSFSPSELGNAPQPQAFELGKAVAISGFLSWTSGSPEKSRAIEP